MCNDLSNVNNYILLNSIKLKAFKQNRQKKNKNRRRRTVKFWLCEFIFFYSCTILVLGVATTLMLHYGVDASFGYATANRQVIP